MSSRDSVIVKNPNILSGMPVFRGTRVPLQLLFDSLERGHTLEAFVEGYPTVAHSCLGDNGEFPHNSNMFLWMKSGLELTFQISTRTSSVSPTLIVFFLGTTLTSICLLLMSSV